MVDSTSFATVILLAAAASLLFAAMLYPATLLRWFQRKRYQYEVTFSLYMLTSTEKFIFNSVLFLLLSLFIIAASLYLPEHLNIITRRLSYYFSGNEDTLAASAQKVGQQVVASSLSPNALLPQNGLGGALAGQGRGIMDP
ncbi:uncharacterized protein K460DRAFT_405039 [Cucurbitaria berberidis CBS 394.84]|uniref:Uncharacterized protein n=1 Tax=Cucurbitaria berberidis CBS 394.84 TaxID=1168544 RepID=A0A9P4GFS1_9PLEO|nr:uncharacterized protein K460DRAFT_405039 [Cucurbitaria berberidis CBS 394.84]KAF1844755.1 hypothetical protein K460DRAFT_405039 [Cucurbitaria berberidis CBS 394.84]